MADAKAKKPAGQKHNHGPGRRWVKGQSGNPAGAKPKGEMLTPILRAHASLNVVTKLEGHTFKGTRAEVLSQILWSYALKGDMAASKLIIERLDGKPVQPLHHTGDLEPVALIIDTSDEADQPGDGQSSPDDSKAV